VHLQRAAEQLVGLSKLTDGLALPFQVPQGSDPGDGDVGDSWHTPEDHDAYLLAKSYFDSREFDRCAWHLRDSDSPKAMFLWGYAKYLVRPLCSSHATGTPSPLASYL
jgi:hypothetical protein